MEPMTMMALLGALGLGKSELIDRPREQRQRKLAAQTALYSPWTGMSPDKVQEADPFGSTLQGVTAGAMYGQQSEANQMAKDELKMKQDYYEKLGNSLTPAKAADASQTPVEDLNTSDIPKLKNPSLGYSSRRYNPYLRMS